MKKLTASLLVLVLCLLGLSLGLPPSMAAPVVTYAFLANASSATWTGWEPTTSHPLTFGTQSFTAGFAMNFSGILEDGNSVSNAVETYVPSAAPSGITGDYYYISIPAFAQLELTYGFKQGANATDGVVVGVAYAEDKPGSPLIELFKQSKTYDGTLGKATIDLTAYAGQVGGFQLFVRSGATATADALVWVKAVLEVTSPVLPTATAIPTPLPTPTLTAIPTPLVLHFFVGNTTYFVGTNPKTMDTAPVIVESRTLLPIRYVAQELGATVDWYPPDKVEIKHSGNTIDLWIGQNSASVNGSYVLIDPGNPNVVPFIQPPGRTMMPLRFISENLGAKVEWFPPDEARITYPAP